MIKSKFFGHHLIELISVDSTNNYSTKLIRTGDYQDGTVIMAEYQTEGKGRRGKKWQSLANQNLTFSLIRDLKKFPLEEQFLITQVTSLAILESLKDLGLNKVEIKWPNDILVNRKKIAGILIENTLSGQNIDSTIIGIGLNVNQVDFDGLPATSIINESKSAPNKKELLQTLLENIQTGFHQILLGNKQWVNESYNENVFGKSSFENYIIEDKTVECKITLVCADGSLLLQSIEGDELSINKLDQIQWVNK